MLTKKITSLNNLDLQARPAAMSVQLASKVQDEFWVEKDGEQINGESIMGLKAVACGSSNWVITDGPDQQAAMLALQELLTTRSPVS